MFCIFPGTFFSKILIFNRQIDSYGSVGIYSAGHIPRVIIGANYTITYHEAIVLTPMRSEAPNKQGPTELIREFLFFFRLSVWFESHSIFTTDYGDPLATAYQRKLSIRNLCLC